MSDRMRTSRKRKQNSPARGASEAAQKTSIATHALTPSLPDPAHWWVEMMQPAVWQEQIGQIAELAGTTVPVARRTARRMLRMVGRTSRKGSEIVKTAIDATQAPLTAEAHASWLEFWKSNLNAAQSNFHVFTTFGTRAMDAWARIVSKNHALNGSANES